MEIEVRNVTKMLKGVPVLDGVNLHIGVGLFGLLGSNGAGKTTLIRILATALGQSSGEILYDGEALRNRKKLRGMIGYVPQEFSFYPDRTVYEILDYFCGLENIRKKERQAQIEYLLNQVNLIEHRKKKTKELSGGMKRRLGIATALAGNPQVLLVDEPTVGLDPIERMKFRNILLEFSRGKTVLLSTHIVSDIEEICKNVAVMNHGQVIFQGTQEELLGKVAGQVWEGIPDKELLSRLEREYLVTGKMITEQGTYIRLISKEPPVDVMKLANPHVQDAYMYVIDQDV